MGQPFYAVQRMVPLSIHMYQLACFAAHRSGIEPREPSWLPAFALPLDAVVHAATALEAFFNEEMAGVIAGNPQEWEAPLKAVERITIEDKWLLVSKLLFGRSFDKGAEPFQSFKMLVQLRNELVHYKAEFTTGDNMPNFAARLESKFTFSRSAVPEAFARMGAARVLDDWPDVVLNRECARWACLTARKMVLAWRDLHGDTHARSLADYRWSQEYLEGRKPDFPNTIPSWVVTVDGKVMPEGG